MSILNVSFQEDKDIFCLQIIQNLKSIQLIIVLYFSNNSRYFILISILSVSLQVDKYNFYLQIHSII